MFDTKIAIVVREDLAAWQKLNVTAFLSSGLVAGDLEVLGKPYEDAVGNVYNPMIVQPVIVLTANADAVKAIYGRAMAYRVRLSLYIDEMFATTHDDANRAALMQHRPQCMPLAGLAMRESKRVVDRITKGARMHP